MPHKKIIARIFGGLGNQLFAYAAARRLALVNNAELVIDDISGFSHDKTYQRHYQLDHFMIPCRKATPSERLEPFSLIRRYLLRSFNSLLPFNIRNFLHESTAAAISPDIEKNINLKDKFLKYRVKGAVRTEGYWQSEGYFKDVEDSIRSDLKFKPITDFKNINMVEKIKESISVGVHIRYFDIEDNNSLNNIQVDYYLNALEEINSLVPDAHFFFFSDHPNLVSKHIPFPTSRTTFILHNIGDENAYADLWLMSHCKHFIIANSTFSWWGAWLSVHSDKSVIAPSFERLKSGTNWSAKGLLPDDWIKI